MLEHYLNGLLSESELLDYVRAKQNLLVARINILTKTGRQDVEELAEICEGMTDIASTLRVVLRRRSHA